MSLRLRLFLLFAGVLTLLLVAQVLLVRSLTGRLTENVRTVAVNVGNQILSGFELHSGEEDGRRDAGHEARVVVLAGDPAHRPHAGEDDRGPGREPDSADKEAFRWIVREDATWGGGSPPPPPPPPGGAQPRPIPPGPERRPPAGEPGIATIVTERHENGAVVSREVRRFALDAPPEADMLFLRGPKVERAIPIPHAEVSTTLERFGSHLLIGSLAILALGLVASFWITRQITRPLGELATAARRVGEGELGVAVASRRTDEVGQAIASFNRMSERLVDLDRENRRLSDRRQLAELGDVARGLAHSLRNPLNALGLSLEELGARAQPESNPAPLVETARRQIRRIDGALRSFLALASTGSAAPEAVDLTALAREVALEALQDSRGRVRVSVEAEAPVPPLSALAAELRAILQALVVNAVEASPDGATVAVRVVPAGAGRVGVEIVDRGGGLAPEIRERLFTPHLTTKANGSGMGLYLAHRLATGRYAGSLELTDGAGGGTIARLQLGNREGESVG